MMDHTGRIAGKAPLFNQDRPYGTVRGMSADEDLVKSLNNLVADDSVLIGIADIISNKKVVDSIRNAAVDLDINNAIDRYALYLEMKATLDLCDRWKKLESLLEIWFSLQFRMNKHSESLAESIDARLSIAVKESPHDHNMLVFAVNDTYFEHLNRFRSLYKEILYIFRSVSDLRQLPTRAQIAACYLKETLHNFLNKHNQCTEEIAKQRLLVWVTYDEQILYGLDKLVDLILDLETNRHLLLEPLLKTIKSREVTKKKPIDHGTRDLLQVAQAASLSIKDLAKILVERKLDGGIAGPKGSVEKETARLRSIQWKQKNSR